MPKYLENRWGVRSQAKKVFTFTFFGRFGDLLVHVLDVCNVLDMDTLVYKIALNVLKLINADR